MSNSNFEHEHTTEHEHVHHRHHHKYSGQHSSKTFKRISIFIFLIIFAGATALFMKTPEEVYIDNPKNIFSTTQDNAKKEGAIFKIDSYIGTTKPLNYLIKGDFKYIIYKDYVLIDSYLGTDRKVVIPATLDDKPVIGINKHAFLSRHFITEVVISEGIKSLGTSSFTDCTHLEKITFPKSLREIAPKAFYQCERLKEADVPSKVGYLGESAFAYCYELEKVVLRNENIVFGKNVFTNCGTERITFYSYDDSNTQEYCEKSGYMFKEIS